MDNGVTPVMSNQPSAQSTYWRQHEQLRQKTETFEKIGDGIPIIHIDH